MATVESGGGAGGSPVVAAITLTDNELIGRACTAASLSAAGGTGVESPVPQDDR